jgi:hypothetical protein
MSRVSSHDLHQPPAQPLSDVDGDSIAQLLVPLAVGLSGGPPVREALESFAFRGGEAANAERMDQSDALM